MPDIARNIGYAARTAANLRYAGDNREINLEFSAELGSELLALLIDNPAQATTPALSELHLILLDVMS